MPRFTLFFLVVLSLTGGIVFGAPAPATPVPTRPDAKDLAVVDLGRVYDHFARLENLIPKLGEKANAMGADLSKRVRRLIQLQDQARQFRVNLPSPPDPADMARLTSMEEEIRFLQEELSTTEREKYQEVKDRELLWSREILRAAQEQIRRMAASEKLTLILDKGDWMLHLSPKIDLTDRIIRNMERERSSLRFQ